MREWNAENAALLGDSYVKDLITKKSRLTFAAIPQSMVEAKRLEVISKRVLRPHDRRLRTAEFRGPKA